MNKRVNNDKASGQRLDLHDVISRMKEGDISVDEARVITNAHGKIIGSLKVQIDYAKLVGAYANAFDFFPLEDAVSEDA